MDTIWDDPLRIVTHHDGNDDLETLLQTRAILPPKTTWTRQIIERSFEGAGIEVRTLIETNNLETIRRMVEIGLGWSVLPATMLSPSLRTVPTSRLMIHRQLGVIRHRKRSISNAANAMIGLLKQKEERL
jgi:DNA-binding transcriptional LysR family regulator